MCGICGIYSKRSEVINPEVIVKMRDVMENRGPDDFGLYSALHIGLGHRRLSIIDLSPNGKQPMTNEDGTIYLVFNGEIYNFREIRINLIEKGHIFRSKTDSEVLIHGYEQWGIENLVQKINGMFALAIWDSNKEELILARDRLGVKPLFYLEENGKVYFSSDIKSIWLGYDKDLTINYNAIDHFLYSKCIPQEYSIFNNVRKVLPAHFIKFTKNKTAMKSYWQLSFALKDERSEDEIIEELKERILQAVKRRMISDVPLGAFLSGGIDSSLVVANMAMISDTPVKTFSIGFTNESYNELKYAKMVAQKYATEHHEYIVEPDAISILPELIWGYGEPFADSSQIPTYYVSKITKKYVTTALTGDGGDESFAGYSNIAAHYYGNLYRKYLPSFLGDIVLPPLIDSLVNLTGRRGIAGKIKTLIEYGAGDFIDSIKITDGFYFNYRDSLYSSNFKKILFENDPRILYKKYFHCADGFDEIDKVLFVDIKTRLPNDYLTKVDIASMMNSLEVRSPFVDYELMQFAAQIPISKKLKYGRQKYLLKKLASGFLPNEVIYRKKSGFVVPICHWMRDDKFAILMKEILLSDRAQKRGYFSKSFIKILLDEHLTRKKDHTSRLWSLLCLEIWQLMFIDRVLSVDDNLGLSRL